MSEPLTLACPTCGRRYEVPPAATDDIGAACTGENKTHRIAVMRVVDDVVEAEL